MAAHMQQQILTAYRLALVAASTAAGSDVYVDHPDELTPAMLPAIVLTEGPEQVQDLSMDTPVLQMRTLQLDVVAICSSTTAAADARDLGRQIEAALYSESTAGGLVQGLSLRSSEPQINGGASQLLAERRQTWQVTYYTRAGQPDAPA